jgi:hypothetical protein
MRLADQADSRYPSVTVGAQMVGVENNDAESGLRTSYGSSSTFSSRNFNMSLRRMMPASRLPSVTMRRLEPVRFMSDRVSMASAFKSTVFSEGEGLFSVRFDTDNYR